MCRTAQTYLDKYDFYYNINAQANSILGYKHTEETKARFKGRQPFKGKTPPSGSEENRQITRDLATKNRIEKQLNSKIKLSNLFLQFSKNNETIQLLNDILTELSSKLKKIVRITDNSNNQSILFSSIKLASSVLCCNPETLRRYEKDRRLFSYKTYQIIL